ncbi:hypothetical protein PQX77_018324 [Marasmius sp. AFHP31]|nr:hypothetical protein PQX77_018324 [Marasmius sp. AFHP31]
MSSSFPIYTSGKKRGRPTKHQAPDGQRKRKRRTNVKVPCKCGCGLILGKRQAQRHMRAVSLAGSNDIDEEDNSDVEDDSYMNDGDKHGSDGGSNEGGLQNLEPSDDEGTHVQLPDHRATVGDAPDEDDLEINPDPEGDRLLDMEHGVNWAQEIPDEEDEDNTTSECYDQDIDEILWEAMYRERIALGKSMVSNATVQR